MIKIEISAVYKENTNILMRRTDNDIIMYYGRVVNPGTKTSSGELGMAQKARNIIHRNTKGNSVLK